MSIEVKADGVLHFLFGKKFWNSRLKRDEIQSTLDGKPFEINLPLRKTRVIIDQYNIVEPFLVLDNLPLS